MWVNSHGSRSFERFFTNEQIDTLLTFRTKVDHRSLMHEWDETMMSPVKALFQAFGVDQQKTLGLYFHTKFPFTTHVEGSITSVRKTPINTTILVPLDVEPEDSETHTIFFNQFDDTPDQDRRFYRHTNLQSAPQPVKSDYSGLVNITDEPFDNKEIYDEYLDYIDYGNLHGLTFHLAAKWHIGDVIKFESTRLHASAGFNNVPGFAKSHLVFTTYLPE